MEWQGHKGSIFNIPTMMIMEGHAAIEVKLCNIKPCDPVVLCKVGMLPGVASGSHLLLGLLGRATAR